MHSNNCISIQTIKYIVVCDWYWRGIGNTNTSGKISTLRILYSTCLLVILFRCTISAQVYVSIYLHIHSTRVIKHLRFLWNVPLFFLLITFNLEEKKRVRNWYGNDLPNSPMWKPNSNKPLEVIKVGSTIVLQTHKWFLPTYTIFGICYAPRCRCYK